MRRLGVGWLLLGLLAIEGRAAAATDRIALLQADAFLCDARNQAKVVREGAERLAKAAAPDDDPSFAALVRAVTNLSQKVAAIRRDPGAPAGFDEAAGAAVDVERDIGALRKSVTARDARGIREDADHLLQAIDRVDGALDRVFATVHLDRIQVLRRGGAAAR